MSNINTFGSLKKRDNNQSARSSGSSSDDEGQQAFYAGGSERSGQQVLGPPGAKKNPNQLIADMFKSAREAGAQVLDRSAADAEPGRPQRVPFSGAGYSLSSSSDNQTATRSGSPGLETPQRCVRRLKMWRNGFSIDDGELRHYNDAANAEFLACIQRGEVPRELIAEAHGGEVNLNMEDHRTEEYSEPKRKVNAFAGEGHRLGNVTADIVVPSSVPVSVDDAKKNEEDARAGLKLDENKPTTQVQVRLADGSRITIKVNLTHTISDLRNYICTARPTYACTPFYLMTTFPNKTLDDEKLTIEQAKLQNAVVVQRLQ